MNFAELGLHPFILKALESTGYAEPSPVQAQAIPAALGGADLLVSAQTGSGKTAAFLLPSLSRLVDAAAVSGNGPRILVLTPTRELAVQVEKAARTYGRELRRLRSVSLVGGEPYGLQLKMLSQPVDVVVATPGRLMDHMERGRIDFSRLEVLVLDEADRMLDMGFIDDIQAIVARTPRTRQTLLFSATLDGEVGVLARAMTRDPQRIEVVPIAAARAQIDQHLLFADNLEHKTRLLDHLLTDVSVEQALVFTATKAGAEELSQSLRERGFPVEALHGDMPQHKRTKTLDRLRSGRTKVLVATDVAARGIDVAGISHVINFDAPRQAEDYVHRIGRTGRAGRSGKAVTLLGHKERHLLRNIERFTGQAIRIEVIVGLEPTQRPERDKPRRPRPDGGYKGRSGQGYPDSKFRKEHGQGGQRSSADAQGPARDTAPASGWVGRAGTGAAAGWDGRRWHDDRGGKPYGQRGDAAGGGKGRDGAAATGKTGERSGYAGKDTPRGGTAQPVTTGYGAGNRSQRDHKHPQPTNKPKRDARYW